MRLTLCAASAVQQHDHAAAKYDDKKQNIGARNFPDAAVPKIGCYRKNDP